MNIQPTAQIQQIQTGQPIYLSNDNSQKSQIIQIANQNGTNQNVIYTNQQILQPNPNGYYIIQQQQTNNNNQFSILPTSSNTTMSQTNAHFKQLTPQQPILIQQNNIKYPTTTGTNSPRIIIQQQPTNGQLIQALPQQTNQQLFLNINNRIVPIQSVNIKTATAPQTTPQTQPQGNQQFVIVSNSSNVNTNQTIQVQNTNQTTSNLSGDISDKMKQLEQIQNQLKQYQQKILQLTNHGQTQTQTVLTQAQIQAVLTTDEQIQLQKLIVSKKQIENEIQQLKQKLLTQPTPTSKVQLLQQVTEKLNALRSSKTVTLDANTGQQQLVLTHEEFDKMKKLIDLQNSLQNELKSEQKPVQQQQQQQQPQITTTINFNDANLNQKLKLNEILKNQIEQLKQNIANQSNKETLQQAKDKYILLIKKQTELQGLIDKETNQKQTPVKIRNVITPIQVIKTNAQQSPLRTLVINNKDNVNVTSPVQIASPSVSTSQIVLTLQQALILKKHNFPNLQFKCLSFEELAQNGVITKDTDELTLNLLKQLDERASQVINREQLESFQKNQVKLARKYLEQQQYAKQTIKNRINEQLVKDQKLASEPDYKTGFTDKTDAIKRLSRYHVFQKTYFEPSEQESNKFEECYEQVSERLLKIADSMKKRFNLLQLRSMQKEVSSSEETLVLKLYVDDLKHNIEHEKQDLKEKQNQHDNHHHQQQQQQKSQIQIQKPQVQVIKTDSPQTIRNLIKMSQMNTTSDTITSLKRVLKQDEDEKSSPKIQKLEPCISFTSTDKSESNTSLNHLSSSAYPSSSSSSFGLKTESKINEEIDETLINDQILLDDYDEDSNDDSDNPYEQYETFRRQNVTELDLNEDYSSSGLNNLSNLDDFILNDDDLAVQSILDF